MSAHNKNGFTLIETIIYIGLFSLIFTGIFVSIYPIFTGAERLTKNIAGEGETAFILARLDYALGHVITDPSGQIVSPAEGETSSVLILEYDNTERFRFAENSSNEFCTAPLLCHTLTQSDDGGRAFPLNTQRVSIQNFEVIHTAPSGSTPRFIDVTFKVNGTEPGDNVGPIRYYVHF